MLKEIKRVIIIGGSGYLGSQISKLFLSKKIEVISFDLYQGNEVIPSEFVEANLSTLSIDQIEQLFSPLAADVVIYALGPDDRAIVSLDATTFFQDKLVELTRKVLTAAKNQGIKKAVVLGSYFEYFNELKKGKLERHHPYIKARKDQADVISGLSNSNFQTVLLELPYIFGIKPGTKPLWKEHFLDQFASYKYAFIPIFGGTSITTRNNVANAVYGAAFYDQQDFIKVPVGDINLSFKELLKEMMYSSGMNKLVKRVPGFIMAIGTIKLRNQLKRENKSAGLHYGYLMTQIMNHYFYLEEKKYRQTLYLDQYHLSYDEMILEVIDETIRYCYQKNETQK